MSHRPIPTPSRTLGIDFGTSNSAAGVLMNGAPRLIEIEPGQKTLPTSVFFDFDRRTTLFGSAANDALIAGEEGRFMRALKSVLGTTLMHEPRQLLNERLTFVDIIARFLARLKAGAEAACDCRFDLALSGRPVHFHSADAGRDARALDDLRACYAAAGFRDVRFLFEPEAAAIAKGGDAQRGLGLIVDIGGGTSDFSLFEGAAGRARIIVSHGVRVGGTNFDRALSIDHVMPLLGKGTDIRNELGSGRHTAPNALFNDLATWEKIPFLYTPETRRAVAQMARLAEAPDRFARLAGLLDMELGHDVAFAVERGKIDANAHGSNGAFIDLGVLEKGLTAPLGPDDLRRSLHDHASRIDACARETLAMADIPAHRVETVIFVGGSSLMGVVIDAMRALFPGADLRSSTPFTAVVDGLAIASASAFD